MILDAGFLAKLREQSEDGDTITRLLDHIDATGAHLPEAILAALRWGPGRADVLAAAYEYVAAEQEWMRFGDHPVPRAIERRRRDATEKLAEVIAAAYADRAAKVTQPEDLSRRTSRRGGGRWVRE